MTWKWTRALGGECRNRCIVALVLGATACRSAERPGDDAAAALDGGPVVFFPDGSSAADRAPMPMQIPQGTLVGRVTVARAETPIEGVDLVGIRLGGPAVSDARGDFTMTRFITTFGGTLLARHWGYAQAARWVAPTGEATPFVEVPMVPVAVTTRVSVAASNTVSDGAGASALFHPYALTESGTAPASGAAWVMLTTLDPSDPAQRRALPGRLLVASTGGRGTTEPTPPLLEPLAALYVAALEAGRELAGTTVVRIPIPPSVVASAPATLALWRSDWASSTWGAAGTATRVADPDAPSGAVYQATVTYLGWFVVGRQLASQTCLRGCVRAGEAPAPAAHVEATGLDHRGVWSGYTGADGCFAVGLERGGQYALRARGVAGASVPLTVTAPTTEIAVGAEPSRCLDVGTLVLQPES